MHLLLEHASDLRTARDICSLLQVSTAVRQAAQHSRGYCKFTTSKTLKGLDSFCAWLPKHCGLVSHITVCCFATDAQDVQGRKLLESALRSCAVQHPTGAAVAEPVAATGNSSSMQDLRRLPLKLYSFSTDYIISAGMLGELMKTDVSELEMFIPEHFACASFCAQLAGMQCLQRLQISFKAREQMPQILAESIGQLQQLTFLESESFTAAAAKALPATLKALKLHQLEALGNLDLAHLTSLQQLDLRNRSGAELVNLPAALRRVFVERWVELRCA